MTIFNTKKKLTDCYFIERIFDRGTYRFAHRDQQEDDSSGGEAKNEKISTQRRNWQTAILLKASLIEKLTGWLIVSYGRIIVRVEKPRKKKIYTVGILSKYEANMCWVKIREKRLCPLTAYLSVLIELYTTEVLMMQNETWQRWDSNPRLRRDWCLKPAP